MGLCTVCPPRWFIHPCVCRAERKDLHLCLTLITFYSHSVTSYKKSTGEFGASFLLLLKASWWLQMSRAQSRLSAGVCNVNFVTQLGPDCLSITSLNHYNFLPFSHVKFFVTGVTWNSFAGSTTERTQTSEQNVLGWKTKESYMLCCTKMVACFSLAVLVSWVFFSLLICLVISFSFFLVFESN